MAGSGKAPKDSDRRVGRGGRKSTKVASNQVTTGVPEWPLGQDVALDALISVLDESITELEAELLEEADRRKRGGLSRKLDNAKRSVATARARREGGRQLELAIWTDLWQLPHADHWRQLGWTRDIAQYVRHKAKGEMGSLDDAKEARQWSDRLGLSPRAATQLGMKFVNKPTPTVGEAKSTGSGSVTDIKSRRARLVDDAS